MCAQLCIFFTLLLCFTEREPEPEKFKAPIFFHDTHSAPSADGVLCFIVRKNPAERREKGGETRNETLTLRTTPTHQTAEEAEKRGRRGKKRTSQKNMIFNNFMHQNCFLKKCTNGF